MKIGILTFHRAYNCGAMLQAYALQHVLEGLGHDVCFPDCNNVGEIGRFYNLEAPRARSKPWLYLGWLWDVVLSVGVYRGKRKRFVAFRDKWLKHSVFEKRDLGQNFDCLIVGSDQVWNSTVTLKNANLFYGIGVDAKVPMIGYAVSIGDYSLGDDVVSAWRKALRRFVRFSTREESAQQLLTGVIKPDVQTVLDPTLLLEEQEYAALSAPRICNEPYIFIYATPSEELLRRGRWLAKKLGLRLIVGYFWTATRHLDIPEMIYNLSPDVMLSGIRNAEYVLTNSFHGTAISIVHHKHFLAVSDGRETLQGRVRCLLDRLGVGERQIDASCSDEEMLRRIGKDVAGVAYEVLALKKEESIKFIKESLLVSDERRKW